VIEAASLHIAALRQKCASLDRLRLLEMIPSAGEGMPPKPIEVPLVAAAPPDLEAFANEMQDRQDEAGGLMRSAYGKARGLALRLALNLKFMWLCGRDGYAPPPASISHKAFIAAATLIADYLMPHAERAFGDAATPKSDRDAATLARWIVKTCAREVHVRQLQREVRLPGLNTAEAIHAAAEVLFDAGWIGKPEKGAFQHRGRIAYPVNPAVHEARA
jgi:hypothetical protein